jgi:transcriptional regulator with XRE-family HTH domain
VNPARVRQARAEAGLSLAQVAGDEVSRTFIHFVEQGRSRPSQSVLALIARRTGKPIAYFLDGNPHDEPGSELAEELTRAAGSVRRFAARRGLTAGEREAMKLVETTLQHGARVARAVEKTAAG